MSCGKPSDFVRVACVPPSPKRPKHLEIKSSCRWGAVQPCDGFFVHRPQKTGAKGFPLWCRRFAWTGCYFMMPLWSLKRCWSQNSSHQQRPTGCSLRMTKRMIQNCNVPAINQQTHYCTHMMIRPRPISQLQKGFGDFSLPSLVPCEALPRWASETSSDSWSLWRR